MMADREPQLTRADAVLILSAAILGLAAASAFGAFQAVNGDDGALRDFAVNLVWPGVLIFAGVAATVWFGWKANLD
jgi:hypothetical protein